jgi:hypothetical protein
MVTLEESLLASVTNTPEAVGVARVTAMTADSPGDTVTPEPSMISAPESAGGEINRAIAAAGSKYRMKTSVRRKV